MFSVAVTTFNRTARDLGCHWTLDKPSYSVHFSLPSTGS